MMKKFQWLTGLTFKSEISESVCKQNTGGLKLIKLKERRQVFFKKFHVSRAIT